MTAAERLAAAPVRPYPFRHVIVDRLFEAEDADCLLTWLETAPGWSTQARDFYVHDARADLGEAVPRSTVQELATTLGTMFDVDLAGEQATVTAHRMGVGQGIGIHTDDPVQGTEALRLVVTLRRDRYRDSDGGHLLLFCDDDVRAITTVVRPLHNSAVAFPLSPWSFHAVTDIADGVRHSVVLGFWTKAQVKEAVVVDLLRIAGAGRTAHSGRTLLDHLLGVGDLLRSWGCDPEVVVAGLLHSVYGTAGFGSGLLGEDDRERVRQVAGTRSEELAWLFSAGSTRRLTPRQVGDLDLLALANLLEQVPGNGLGPGERHQCRQALDRLGSDLPSLARRQVVEALDRA